MRVALFQGKPPVAEVCDFEVSVSHLKRLAIDAKRSDASILVTPELFMGGYRTEDIDAIDPNNRLRKIANIARDVSINMIIGFPEKLENDQVANSAAAIDRNGRVLGIYRKTHLFGKDENAAFVKGESLSNLFHFDGICIGILICYDVEFPEAVRTVKMNGADVIIVPTANFHPYDFINDYIIQVRAFENGVPIVYCNWSEHKNNVVPYVQFNGKSIVVDSNGTSLLRLRPSDEGLWIMNVPTCSTHHSRTTTTPPESDYIRDRRPELYKTILHSKL